MSTVAIGEQRWRVPLFVALLALGVGYIVVFVFLARHSSDFIARDRTAAAMSAAASRSALAGVELVFKNGSADLRLLATGWRQPDNEGTWSEAEGGTLYLPVSFAAGETVEVRFDGQLNPPDREMQVTLDIDGREVASWQLTHVHWQIAERIAMPGQTRGDVPRQLRFRIDRPARPLWLGYEPGLLAYGIHLYRLRLVSRSGSE